MVVQTIARTYNQWCRWNQSQAENDGHGWSPWLTLIPVVLLSMMRGHVLPISIAAALLALFWGGLVWRALPTDRPLSWSKSWAMWAWSSLSGKQRLLAIMAAYSAITALGNLMPPDWALVPFQSATSSLMWYLTRGIFVGMNLGLYVSHLILLGYVSCLWGRGILAIAVVLWLPAYTELISGCVSAVCCIMAFASLASLKESRYTVHWAMGALISAMFGVSWVLAMLIMAGLILLRQSSSMRGWVMMGLVGVALGVISNGYWLQTEVWVVLMAAALVGWGMTRRVSMIHLPQLMAVFHSLVGLASAFLCAAVAMIATHDVWQSSADSHPWLSSADSHPWLSSVLNVGYALRHMLRATVTLEWLMGASLAALTFTGSLVAGAQLSGWGLSAAWKKRARNGALMLSAALIISSLLVMIWPCITTLTAVMMVSAMLGVLLVVPIGGGDMPVVISLLNACSGWAILGIGLSFKHPLYIIVGSIVGCSGAVLSWSMCRGMNRSLWHVLWPSVSGVNGDSGACVSQGTAQTMAPEDAGFMLGNAQRVVIIPGYGMAAAHAQHALQDLAQSLKQRGVKVSYAIHSVAGRMPGHMNVLLAEAKVPYEWMMDDEESQAELAHADVALVIGANDIVNTLALDPASSLSGMPIFDLQKTPTVLIIKRSMGTGYAGLDNPLFYQSNTYMILGDAKTMCTQIRQSL